MYFYFFLCAIGSPPGDSWKKRITQLQMVQFVVDATFPLSWPVYNYFVCFLFHLFIYF